jgi:hypothetical protein
MSSSQDILNMVRRTQGQLDMQNSLDMQNCSLTVVQLGRGRCPILNTCALQ